MRQEWHFWEASHERFLGIRSDGGLNATLRETDRLKRRPETRVFAAPAVG